MPGPLVLTIYSRPGCHLCDEMKAVIANVLQTSRMPLSPVRVEEIDVEGDADLERRFGLEVPVLLMNGKKMAKYRITAEDLRRILRAREEEAG
jgi:glutaredoxin